MKFLRTIIQSCSLILLLLLVSCGGGKRHAKIDVFTTFPEHSLSYKRILTDLHNEYNADEYSVNLYAVNIDDSTNIDEIENYTQIREKIEHCLDTMSQQPDIIMFHGDLAAHSAATSQVALLSTTPAVCVHITFAEYLGLLERRKNFVVFESPFTMTENMNFIENTGGFKPIAIMLDSTYLDNHMYHQVIEQLDKDSKRMHYEDIRDNNNVKEPKLCYLRMNNECFADNVMEENIGLYYTVNPEVFNLDYLTALHGCLGGYFTTVADMYKQAHPVVDALLKGKTPQQIGWQKHHCDYWLDWRNARLVYPYAEDFPHYAHFVNLPWKYKSRLHMLCYRLFLPLLLLLMVVICVGLPIFFKLVVHIQRQKLLEQGRQALEMEEQLQSILASIKAYHFHVTSDYKVVLPPSVGDFGIRPRSMSLGVLLEMIKEPVRSQILEFIYNTPDVQEFQSEATYCDFVHNTEHHLLISIIKLQQNGAGYICSGMYIFNDQDYQVDAELKEALRRGEELTAKESFLAAMGHEIRTPLNAIAGFSQVLLQHSQDLSDEERATYGEYIIQSNNEMLRLLDNVMNYSRKKGDQIRVELSRHGLSQLIENLYVIHSVIVPKHLSFDLHRGEDGIDVMVNKSSLYQIISNLINNAIKFTKQGGITLGWNVVETETGLRYAIIYVEDTGIGIAPDLQKRIFDRYFKQNNHTVGAGIGLSLCKELVTQMGGTILVKSEEGIGSRFEVIIPTVTNP